MVGKSVFAFMKEPPLLLLSNPRAAHYHVSEALTTMFRPHEKSMLDTLSMVFFHPTGFSHLVVETDSQF